MPLRDRYHRWLRAVTVLTAALGILLSSFGLATARQHDKQTKYTKPPKHKGGAGSAKGKSSKRKQEAHKKKGRHDNRLAMPRERDPAKLVMPEAATDHPVLDVAQQFLGLPYRFGADGGAYDCSGFVRSVFAEVGVDLPHSARDQFGHGDFVSRSDLKPGDLVFFHTYRRDASHVGIYCGEDKFIHATSAGGRVQVDSLNQPYYTARYLGGRRIDPRS